MSEKDLLNRFYRLIQKFDGQSPWKLGRDNKFSEFIEKIPFGVEIVYEKDPKDELFGFLFFKAVFNQRTEASPPIVRQWNMARVVWEDRQPILSWEYFMANNPRRDGLPQRSAPRDLSWQKSVLDAIQIFDGERIFRENYYDPRVRRDFEGAVGLGVIFCEPKSKMIYGMKIPMTSVWVLKGNSPDYDYGWELPVCDGRTVLIFSFEFVLKSKGFSIQGETDGV